MKTNNQSKSFLLAAIVSLGLSATAHAQSKDVVVDGKGDVPYAIDARKTVVRSGSGLCWRTGSWTPAAASTAMAGEFPVGCACDSDIVPKEKCTPPAPPAPAVPAPPPAPEPAAPAPRPTAEKVKLSADTLFDFDKAVLKAEGMQKLDELASQAMGVKLEVILAVGHTDRIGSDAYNQKLSERRAAAVKTYLVGKGIEANRVYTEGKGEKQPVTGGQCDKVKSRRALIECLQPDRRVEVEVIGTK